MIQSPLIASLGLVAAGALVGGPARFFLSETIARVAGPRFPTLSTLGGTLVCNVLGCAAMGALAALIQSDSPYWLLLATGGLGSFTTVSSFAAQSHNLLRKRDFTRAAAYVCASLFLGVGGAALGYGLAR